MMKWTLYEYDEGGNKASNELMIYGFKSKKDGLRTNSVTLNKTKIKSEMTTIGKIHFTLVALINLALVAKLINAVWGGNDKAILLVLLGYPALILLNSIVWAILSGLKRPESKIYKIMAIALLALFLPTLMLSSMY